MDLYVVIGFLGGSLGTVAAFAVYWHIYQAQERHLARLRAAYEAQRRREEQQQA